MSIFSGVEPPAWLTAIAKPVDTAPLAQDIGMMLGGGLLALQADPEAKPNPDGTQPRKGFQKGLFEARNNQMDPNWKVKEAGLVAGVSEKWATAATNWQQLDSAAKDAATWTTKDLPTLTKFQEELKKNPDAVPPVMESVRGMQASKQLEAAQLAMQGMKIKQDNAKLALQNDKTSQAFDQAVSAAPIGIGSAIDELPNQGWNIDRTGKRTTPSTAALRLYNDWATQNGADPKKAFGYKVTAVDAAEARGKSAMDIEKQREQGRMEYGAQRQADRVQIESMKEKYGVDLLAMKLNANATGKGGKVVSEDEFITREYGKVFDKMSKANDNSEHPKPIDDIIYQAHSSLRALYRSSHSAQAKPPVAPTAPATAPASTNAPPDKAKDPLGLF